eukprot:m.130029 g.130029  ORF g.130029 m.130029 type:complete len:210 (+) comp13697_c0_seq1:293-922(+)
MELDEGGAAWEQGLDETWAEVVEADDGTLDQAAVLSAQRKRARRLRDTFGSVKRGMIRNVVLVVDTSASMADIDFRPRRLETVLSALPGFVADFFSQNPISQLAILETRQSRCTQISDLGGSKQRQLDALQQRAARQQLDDKEPRGEVRPLAAHTHRLTQHTHADFQVGPLTRPTTTGLSPELAHAGAQPAEHPAVARLARDCDRLQRA